MIKYEQKAVISELLNENAKLNAIIDNYQPKIQALKDENERLKEENFNFEEIVKLCRCEQYQQTLQEIKEIAERAMAKQQEYKKDFEQILQKISEVKFTE